MTGANIISVRSGDGIDLHVEESGAGVPLLLVHGGLSTTRVFDRVRPRLAASYRCLALGRRGYGQSGDVPIHSYEREAGDVLAVLGELDQPAHVLAHSSGAIVALNAALLGPGRIRSLVLYEPPLPVAASRVETWVDDAEAAIARGDDEEAALIGLREAVGYPPGQLDILRADPSWPARIALAPAWVREFRSIQALPPGTDRFAFVTAATLLLLGSRSAAHAGVSTRALHDSLPHSTIAALPEQGHAALLLAPDLVCDSVVPFLSRH